MKTAFLDKNLFLAAAFLNAFVDLAHKITLQNTVFVSMSGSELLIFSQIVNALILLPFVLLFVPAGKLISTLPLAAQSALYSPAKFAFVKEISKDGEIGEFRAGFELPARRGNAVVVPFFFGGLFGSRFSKRSDGRYKKKRGQADIRRAARRCKQSRRQRGGSKLVF